MRKKASGNGTGQAGTSRAKTEGGESNHREPNSEPTLLATTGRPPREELSAQQLRGISALLCQSTMAAAAKEIGVHPRTISRWFKERAFRAEYLSQMTELQLELWRQMLDVRSEVWNRFLELIRSPDERIALRATTWFLDQMLSVPRMLSNVSPENDAALEPETPPQLRALLHEVEAIDHNDEDHAE